MEAGDLRFFTDMAIAQNGSLFFPGQVVMLLKQDPTWATGRWHILHDGKEGICDEHTLNLRTVSIKEA